MLRVLRFSASHWALNLSGTRCDEQQEYSAKPWELCFKDRKSFSPPQPAITGWSCAQDKHSGKALGTFPNNEVDYPRSEQAPLAGVIQN